MTAASLPRVTIVPDSLVELDTTLASEAARLLGYRALQSSHTHAERKRELYRRLLEAGIQPLDPAGIRRYKTHAVTAKWGKALGMPCCPLATFKSTNFS